MPLIIISGHPTSGKTHRAQQLHSYFTSRISSLPSTSPSSSLRVHLISDHTLGISRSVYNLDNKGTHERSNNASEKDARATIYAAVKRVLSQKDVVILDGANYIKGWRYQLYCEAKAVRTGCCVVYIGVSEEQARRVNEERLAKSQNQDDGGEEEVKEDDKPYEKECWENLVFRYEEPNAMARWDSPLFTVLWEDAEPPCDKIWEVLIGDPENGNKKVVRPNQATVLRAPTSEGFLYELDKITQEVLNLILERGKHHPGEGGYDVIIGKGMSGEELVIEVPGEGAGLPALQRLRRQFIALNRQSAVPVERIRESFAGYLNDVFAA